MFGKDLLQRGIVWRVGNGENIRITRDRWVLDAPCHTVKPTVFIPDELRVSALIDTITGRWNEELIAACFSSTDASRILQIPLSCNRVPDCVSWPWTKTGTFTVKSAYIMARCQQVYLQTSAQGKGATSNQDQAANDWKRLWKIKVPPKMLIMLWRFVHDCLPTGQQLKNRNITASEVCCHCAREENLHHTFIGCQYVAEVWKELKKRTGLKINQKWCGSARNWLFDILSRCTSRETTILAIAFWHIWEARNAMRNGETELHPWCLVEKILAYVDMVFLHCYQSISPKRCESTMPNQWSPPPEGWIMINVDAAIFVDANRMGLGLVVRDHRGELLAAFRQGIDKITNPELVETIAFRRALFFAMQLPYDKVVVASDCLTLINKLRSRKVDRSHTGIIVEDIKQLMRVSSVVFSFIHVSRNCNEVAHALAKSADQLCVSEWFHSPPELILSKLCNDRR